MIKNFHIVPKWLVVLTLFLFGAPGRSYPEVPDSLKHRIDSLLVRSSTAEGMDKYQADFDIAWELFDIDNEIALRHAELAHNLAKTTADTMKILKSGRLYGQLLRRNNELDEAERVFFSLLRPAVQGKYDAMRGRILHSLALLQTYQARYDQALINNLKALRIWKSEGDTTMVASSQLNIGLTYYKMGDFKEAIAYFERGLTMGAISTRSVVTMNLALAKVYVGDFAAFTGLTAQAQNWAS